MCRVLYVWKTQYTDDNCNNEGIVSQKRYWPMHDALNATGRPILFSICDWQDKAATWAPAIGNSWRTTDDIGDIEMWTSGTTTAHTVCPPSPRHNCHSQLTRCRVCVTAAVVRASVMRNLHENDPWWAVAGPGQWNDPDMLEVGNNGLSYDEYVTHFSLWCLIKSPLILGNDIRNMTPDTLAILTNDEVIALNQDSLGVQGHLVNTTEQMAEVWAGPLSDGSVGVVLFNRNDNQTQTMNVFWTDIGLTANATAEVRDLWTHSDVGQYTGQYSVKGVKPHASVTVRVHPVAASERQLVLDKAAAVRSEARGTQGKRVTDNVLSA